MIHMDRLFDLAFVRPPGNSYAKCVSTNPAKNDIDVTLAKAQHRSYVSTLKESGVKVVELPALEDHPDSVFMQDPALLGSYVTIIGRFGEASRRGEEKILLEWLKEHGVAIGQPRFVSQPGTLEGGDVLIAEQEIFVGESSRTNKDGIAQLTSHLTGLKVTSVKTGLFHLLCGCCYLSRGTMTIVPDLVDIASFLGFKFVTIPTEESYAADALYLGEDRVLIPAGFPKTATKLREAGFKPVEVEVSEFYKGDGGVTCLCSPLYKVF